MQIDNQSLYNTLNEFSQSIEMDTIYLRSPQEFKEFIKYAKRNKFSNITPKDITHKQRIFDTDKISKNDIIEYFSKEKDKISFFEKVKNALNLEASLYPENIGYFEELKPLETETENYLNLYWSSLNKQNYFNKFEVDIPIARIFQDGELKINSRFIKKKLSNEELIEHVNKRNVGYSFFDESNRLNINVVCVFFDKESNRLIIKSASRKYKSNSEEYDINIEESIINYNPEDLNFKVSENNSYIYNSNNEIISISGFNFHNNEITEDEEIRKNISYNRMKKVFFSDGDWGYYRKEINLDNPNIHDIEIIRYNSKGETIYDYKTSIKDDIIHDIIHDNENIFSVNETLLLSNGFNKNIKYNDQNQEIITLNYLNGDRKVFIDGNITEIYNKSEGVTKKISYEEDLYIKEYYDGHVFTYKPINDSKNEANFVEQKHFKRELISENFYQENEQNRKKLFTIFHTENPYQYSKITYNKENDNQISRIDYKDGSYKLISPNIMNISYLDVKKHKNNIFSQSGIPSSEIKNINELPTFDIELYNSNGNILSKHQVAQYQGDFNTNYKLDHEIMIEILLDSKEYKIDANEPFSHFAICITDGKKIDLPIKGKAPTPVSTTEDINQFLNKLKYRSLNDKIKP
tara:strand:+ start:1593 stop:3497 length:1905 start_codon:yes stop_codon:yes gene_type:complete